MSLYDHYGTDGNQERSGASVELYGTVFKLARAGGQNKAYAKSLNVKTRSYRRGNKLATRLSDEKSLEIMREVYAEAIVLGWDKVVDRDGNEMPYSRENCIKLLTDLPDLFDDIRAAAEERATFQHEVMEEEAGN